MKINTPNKKSFTLNYELFNHQKTTFKFMLKNPWAYIFNQPGTGKTECIISSIAYHFLEEKAKKILIVSPLSTLKNVWLDSIEFHGLQDTLKPVVVTGTKKQKEKVLKLNAHNVYIINPDGLTSMINELSTIKWDYIAIDEATEFKKHTTLRFKSLFKLIKKRPTYFYLATGTPTPNAPTDCYSLLKLFYPSDYTSFNRFRDTLMTEVRPYTFVNKKDAYETIHKLLTPSICFKKKDVLTELEDTQYFFEKFELSDEQKKHFTLLKKDMITLMENGEKISSENAAVNLSKMIQVLGGSVIDKDGNVHRLKTENKISALKDIIKNKTKNKAIVYCSFREHLKIVQEGLSDYKTVIISGDTPEKERNDIFDLFQKTDEIEVLIAMPICIQYGITLTKADSIIYYSPPFSNKTYEQANARISRISQLEVPKVFHLYGNNCDYGRFMILQKRMSDQDFLLTLLTED